MIHGWGWLIPLCSSLGYTGSSVFENSWCPYFVCLPLQHLHETGQYYSSPASIEYHIHIIVWTQCLSFKVKRSHIQMLMCTISHFPFLSQQCALLVKHLRIVKVEYCHWLKILCLWTVYKCINTFKAEQSLEHSCSKHAKCSRTYADRKRAVVTADQADELAIIHSVLLHY